MSNIWSFAGDPERDDVNTLVVRGTVALSAQPQLVFNLLPNHCLRLDSIRGQRAGSCPLEVGWGYSFRLGGQPMQVSLEGYYNVVKPQVAGEELLGDWTIRTQWQVLSPN